MVSLLIPFPAELFQAGAARSTLRYVSDLARRPSYTPRRRREQRAYRMVVVGGTAGAVAVVGFVLAIAGVISGTIPLIAAIVAVVCALVFRSSVSR
jgi:CHASE2 domain-containing sensor protein